MKLIWSSAFKRAYKKVIKKNPKLKDKIANVLKQLEVDPFHPSLKTHKLSGSLADFGLVLWLMIVGLFLNFRKMLKF